MFIENDKLMEYINSKIMATRMNKTIFGIASCFLFLAACIMASCSQDDGNYDYLSDEEVSKIVIETDTVRSQNPYLLDNIDPGQQLEFYLKVDYAYPERLHYKWFYLKSNYNYYQAEQIGNAMVYPPAQVIQEEKDLNWTCDLNPGTYLFYCEAEDTINHMKAYWSNGRYTVVSTPGSVSGLFMLTERDGQTDIEVFRDPLMLIYNPKGCDYKAYSSATGHYLEGKPRFIHASHTGKTSKNAYLVATDKNLYRISTSAFATVNTWDEMFYNTPEVFDPQDAIFINNCEFLINNGKMHVLYANQPNDMKFSEPIAGNYEAYPFLMRATTTSWGAVAGAINSWQVIYDKKNQSFRPYFSGSSQISNFKTTKGDAFLDANKVPGDVKGVFQMGSSYTGVVTHIGGKPYLYLYNFYNRVDEGDLSARGDRSIVDLSGCEDIMNATMYASSTATGGFYYATPKGVFGFSTLSGTTTSSKIYTCEAGEEITCIYPGGSIGGGWPTSNVILWVGIWNESKKDGKLFQSEMDVDNLVIRSQWGPMFGAPDNPTITTGWGKIVSMCNINAE